MSPVCGIFLTPSVVTLNMSLLDNTKSIALFSVFVFMFFITNYLPPIIPDRILLGCWFWIILNIPWAKPIIGSTFEYHISCWGKLFKSLVTVIRATPESNSLTSDWYSYPASGKNQYISNSAED